MRLVAQRPGELRIKIENPNAYGSAYFMIRRLEDNSCRASEVSRDDGQVVNDYNILGSGDHGVISRDKSTESAMVVTPVQQGGGGTVRESDEAAKTVPRTRFSVLVAPAVGHSKWEPAYWTPRRWVAAKPSDGADRGRNPMAKMWVRVWVVPKGTAMMVPAWPSQTVLDFKRTLARKLGDGATAERLRLYRTEDALEDWRQLDACRVYHETHLYVVVAAAPSRRPTQGRLMAVRARCFGEEVCDLVLQLRARATIAELKEAARKKLRAGRTDALRAVRVGLPCGLPDDWLVCEVTDEQSRVHLIVSNAHFEARQMRLCVSSLSGGQPLYVCVPRCALVRDVKQRVQAEEGFPPHLQRVLFGAETLQDDFRLADYGVASDATLRVVLNLAGGGPEFPEGAEQVEAVQSTPTKGDDAEDANRDADLVVAKVVAGQRRAPPATTRCHYAALLSRAAPLLIIEVSLEAAALEPPAKKPRLARGRFMH
ncbi:polyubiquitin-like isoform X2 [Thrips palmi]|nr:polyubiquitin-like isoform X2 [Thrips palmi]XP_034230346.1 polyubiquitin-like isoform X2 [Thrips palmi]XP_034230354.1 polyubiquitin-like isoform X2 [Thrips palmi]